MPKAKALLSNIAKKSSPDPFASPPPPAATPVLGNLLDIDVPPVVNHKLMRQMTLGSSEMMIQPTESGDILYRPNDPFSDRGLDAILGNVKQAPPTVVTSHINNNHHHDGTQGKKMSFKIAPPPPPGSYHRTTNVTQPGKELIQPADPFSNNGLDAILGTNSNTNTTVNNQQPIHNPRPMHSTGSGHLLIEPRDPFSNSGLDILLAPNPTPVAPSQTQHFHPNFHNSQQGSLLFI